MTNRSQKPTPETATQTVAAGFAENTAMLREKGYRPHGLESGLWYLSLPMSSVAIVGDIGIVDGVPRAEVLRCFGRKDS